MLTTAKDHRIEGAERERGAAGQASHDNEQGANSRPTPPRQNNAKQSGPPSKRPSIDRASGWGWPSPKGEGATRAIIPLSAPSRVDAGGPRRPASAYRASRSLGFETARFLDSRSTVVQTKSGFWHRAPRAPLLYMAIVEACMGLLTLCSPPFDHDPHTPTGPAPGGRRLIDATFPGSVGGPRTKGKCSSDRIGGAPFNGAPDWGLGLGGWSMDG